ncbi:MAG TPA: hypothetical protein VK698_01820 [Kofleriaceae bacterium]|nr:hypothetical protein [Kofleriaceae bacterium]
MKRAVARRTTRGPARATGLFVVAALSITLAAGRAHARPRPTGGTPFTANKTFGFGLILGEPIGLTAKYYLGPSTALDFALGEYDQFREDDDLGVHVDFLWHPVELATADPFVVPLYIGLGARIIGDDDDGPGDDDDVDVGVRAPIGIALDFNRVPMDVFFELAIVIDLIDDDDDDDDADLDAAIGVRYYF